MMSARHPVTGALFNPEWDRVQDRWNALYCDAVVARAQPAPRRYPVHLIRTSAALLAGCAVIAALWLCL